ncbi:ATP-binding protein [Solirubrobacter ginsenosidimutans]|uniref:histidine kinase n=1 Tax=Solirubrobacter ginsenosidimutans TaxID=490573 RepID=A0A9X3N0W6_9ACTN|nr:ATP-binding protein [Solirubrobacter ginsenosidimutans]MDA0166611.1 ATP-binding protein [Solirubrobacter ginsenosidimutans]
MPLRAYLAGLTALFVVAAGAAVVYGRVQAGDDARDAATADARFGANLAAREIGDGIKVLQQTVGAAAGNPGVVTAFAKPKECGLTFGGTDAYTTGHLDLVRTDGSVACSSLKRLLDRSYAGAPWLRRALKEPLLLAPAADPRTGDQVVLATAPVPKLGLVLASFNLDAVGLSLHKSYGGPRGLEFLLADASGKRILTRSIRPKDWIGKPLASTVTDRDVDGVARLYANAKVAGAGWHVYAGADRAQALAATRQLNHRELTIILAGLLLFGLAAAVVHRRIARPLARLGAEVRSATAEGEARPVTVAGPSEISSLARRLNELAVALRREQEAYRVVFEGSPLPMWVHETESRRILEVNDAAVAGYGYPREELVGMSVDQLERSPTEHVRRDGSTIVVSIASHAIDFRGREASVVIAEDVTARERLRGQFQQSQRLESLGQLAGGVAHDFNNLLAVILGYASFIERRAETGSRDERDVVEIRKAGERAVRLTQQLLSFARREVVRPKVLDLTGVVIEMEELLRRTLGEQVVLSTTLAPDLWPIMADYGQLEQVLVNLAVNARDAMPDGGTLTLDTENIVVDEAYAGTRANLPPGHYVRLRVSDTGAGMGADVVARAFEPFFTTKASGGTGLGLATVHGIVTQAGGYAQIYSEPGLGTTFTILWPTTDAPVPEAVVAPQGPAEPGGGETILVVEDEPAMLEVTRRILVGGGYAVLVAGGGADAVRIADDHPGEIDVLLTDVVMPEMLGKEVAARVSALRPGIRVLFMSGYAQPVIGPMGDLSNGGQIVDKPFTEVTLLSRLRALIASPASP